MCQCLRSWLRVVTRVGRNCQRIRSIDRPTRISCQSIYPLAPRSLKSTTTRPAVGGPKTFWEDQRAGDLKKRSPTSKFTWFFRFLLSAVGGPKQILRTGGQWFRRNLQWKTLLVVLKDILQISRFIVCDVWFERMAHTEWNFKTYY